MSRRSMHRDASYLDIPQDTSMVTHNNTITSRLDYSADEASDIDSVPDSAKAVKSTSTSLKSSSNKVSTQTSTKARKGSSSSYNESTARTSSRSSRSVHSRKPTPVRSSVSASGASVLSTPSGVQLQRTFSDSTTRQGTAYSVEWTVDSQGRRRRSTRLAHMAHGVPQDMVDHEQNEENMRREYDQVEYSDQDRRLQYLYGLDGPDYGEDGDVDSVAVTYADDEDEYTDESDNEMYSDEVVRAQHGESLVTTTITAITTIITSIFTLLFYIPVKTVEVISAQFQSDRHRTDSERVSIFGWIWSAISTVTSTVFYVISGLLSWLWWKVGGGAHGAIAQTVQSDVWLLSRTSRLRRRYGCCCLLPLLLLLPFFLASAYYISERGMGLGAFPIFPILAANNSGCCVVNQGTNMTDQELQQKVQAILVGLLADQESRQEQLYADQRKQLNDAQIAALAAHRGELEKMVHGVLKDELTVFTAAQSEKEREYQHAREEAEEAAREAALQAAAAVQAQASDKSTGEQYTHLATQINMIGTKNDGKIEVLGAQIAAVQAKADALSLEVSSAKANAEKLSGAERDARGAAVVQLEEQLSSLRGDIANLQGAQAALLGKVGECCKNDSALALLIKTAVKDEMALLMGGTSGGGGGWFGGGNDGDKGAGGFMGWLSSRYAQQDDVDAKLAALAARLTNQIESIPMTNAQGQQEMMYMHDGVELTAEQVRAMIREALLLYGADKTGQPDYAMESAGGSVISTRCSETYHRRTAQLSLFGIPLWYASNSPRSVIQPDVHPGQCWAFKGTNGYLVIQLAGEIFPTAFALEHIPKALSPTGNIDSAPKDFSVMGLAHDRDTDGVLLGNFTYRDNGEPLQHFGLTEPSTRSFSIIEVRIHTNHGNPEYTCLYRFRVHGNLRRW